jgi:hypothetical protein
MRDRYTTWEVNGQKYQASAFLRFLTAFKNDLLATHGPSMYKVIPFNHLLHHLEGAQVSRVRKYHLNQAIKYYKELE